MVKRNDVILPGKVVGIIEDDGKVEFVIHSAIVANGFDGPESMMKSFFHHFVLGDKNHIHLHDLADIEMPLIVYPNYRRDQKTEFISMLPKRLWGTSLLSL